MRWLEQEKKSQIHPVIKVRLLREAASSCPDDPAILVRLGRALQAVGDYSAATDAYERAARSDPQAFRDWDQVAQCYLDLGRLLDVLDVCCRGEKRAPHARLCQLRGAALHRLGRREAARKAFLAAIALDDNQSRALELLLKPLARKADGGELLDFCDALRPAYKDTVLVRAYRAIALSRLRRNDEALRLIDLDRHVAQVSFEPPAQFGGIEGFNRRLADDILADRAPVAKLGLDINYAPRQTEAFLALRAFMKQAIVTYLEEAPERGLDAAMPPPPPFAVLGGGASVVLRGDSHNGEHVHANGYVSVVYYVQVPDAIVNASDERGALALGSCEKHTGGYTPCWGARYLKPVARRFVLFPSHIFHDVVPSGVSEPRISVAVDLKPRATAAP